MVQIRTCRNVLDNTGIKKVRCFHIIGLKIGKIGSRRVTSAKKTQFGKEWSRGDIVRGLIVTSSKEVQRANGILMKGTLNGIVVMNKKWEPIGTRIKSTLPKEIRIYGYMKVVSISHIII